MEAIFYKHRRRISFVLVLAMVLTMNATGFTYADARTKTDKSKAAGQTEQFDSFAVQNFADLYETGKISCTNKKDIEFDTTTEEGSLLLSGKNSAVSGAAISISQTFDFTGKKVSRIQIDALSKRATKTYMSMYLDDETEPFASYRMTSQAQEDNWSRKKVYSFDMSDATKELSGTHKISFRFQDNTTANSKKTKILLRSIQFVPESIPVVNFHIDEDMGYISDMNGDGEHNTECYGNMSISIPEDYGFEFAEDSAKAMKDTAKTFALDYIRGRGNSTWMNDKKPYKIKLDKKADLFGMGANKHWVLLANYYDNSLLRNRLTYYLARKMGMEYTPECVSVDVVMNHEYLGSYLLCEQIRLGESRVAENDLEDELYTGDDVSGGYLLSMEPYGDETDPVIETERNTFLMESPAEGRLVDEAAAYIQEYLQKTEDAIYSPDFKLEDGTTYADLMDVESAIGYYWMQEFTMNGDAFISTSTYLYKKQDTEEGPGKLYWGPLWDFDYVAWASYDYSMSEESYSGFVNQRTWFERLMEDPVFAEKVKEYWPRFKKELQNAIAEGGILDQYAAEIDVSQKNNFDLWGFTDFGGGWYDDYYGDEDMPDTTLTYEEEIERLREWTASRIAWIDENLDSITPEPITLTFMVDGKEYDTLQVLSGRPVSVLPETPEAPAGKVFAGWCCEYTWIDEETGEEIKDTYILGKGDMLSEDTIFTATFISEDEVVKPEQVFMEHDKIYAVVGMPINLNYVVLPLDVTDSSVTFSYSNPSIVGEDEEEGYLMAKKVGKTTITVTASNGKSASCEVEVLSDDEIFDNYEDYMMTGFSLDKTKITLKPGQYQKLNITTTPEITFSGSGFRYMSTDSTVATVEAGVIIANNPGTTVVLVYNEECESFAMCMVTVEDEKGLETPKPTQSPAPGNDIKEEKTFTAGKLSYEITKDSGKTHNVTVVGASKKNKEKKITIPSTVKYNGKTYKVTEIKANAFAKEKKLTTLVIGKNVTSIGAGVCKDCKKLKTIQIAAKKLKKVGKKAFAGIKKKAVFKVPASKYKAYKKLFKKNGKVQKIKGKK